MPRIRSLLALTVGVVAVASGCGGGTGSATGTQAGNLTRAQLTTCLKQAGAATKTTTEVGFAPPGGPLLVGPDGTGFVVGVFPDSSYAQAQAASVIDLASTYVGKPDAEKNVHVVGNTVWFPQHSPFTGQHLAALDRCLTG